MFILFCSLIHKSVVFYSKKLRCQLHPIQRCHQNGKTSSRHPGLNAEEMSQLARRHIVAAEQTQFAKESKGERLVMRGELLVWCHFLPWLSVRSLVISTFYCWPALLSLSPVYCLIISEGKEPVSFLKTGQYLFIEAKTTFQNSTSPLSIGLNQLLYYSKGTSAKS